MENLFIKKLSPLEVEQFQALIQVFEKVFEMKNFQLPSLDHLRRILQIPGFMVFVAEKEGKVLGD
ncbi:MAG: hypothetical protein WDZ80_06550 [Candidatus Paceibacterota bacterium]